MRIEFLKMQGLGNDFLVFDAVGPLEGGLGAARLRALADRHTGIGFDQALMLSAPRIRKTGFIIACSMPTAAKWNNAVTGRGAWQP